MNGIGKAKWFAVAVFLLFTITTCSAQFAGSTQQCSTSLARSANDFGASLTKQLEADGNLFISPLSIFNALSMVYVGAGGQTAEQMSNALQLAANGFDKSQLNQAFRHLLDVIKTSGDEYKLHLANGMFLQQEYAVNQTYIKNIQTFYDAILKMEDFVRRGTEAKNEINSFVSQSTNKKIDNFLKEPLDTMTVLALVNAIYFKGTWKTKFPKDETRDSVFHKNDGSTKNVKFMMLRNEKFRFFEDYSSNYKFLELPYKGGDVSMLLALSNKYEETPNLDMTSDLLCKINGSFRYRKMENVAIPKFQMKYRKELVNVLKQMGIVDLFSSADLTGIRPQGDIAVSTVVHEAVIEVNEEGSEASAATGIFITRMSINLNVFVADHPFLFYIIDNRNGLVLFSGRVSDP